MSLFDGRVAVVTGAASGIGRSLSETLARRGARVVVTDINEDPARNLVREIEAFGGAAEAVRLDVASADRFSDILGDVKEKYGRLDYLFNNAGLAVGGELYDIALDHWQRAIDVNLMGTIYGTHTAYKIMVAQRYGHIVNVSSLAGLLGYPMGIPYATTKFALVGLSTSLREEAKDYGVRVSVACPGFIDTGFFESATVINARNEDVSANIPLRKMPPFRAARKILQGVRRNRAFIVFPFYARVLWWLFRIHPSLIHPLAKKTVSDFRAVRVSGEPGSPELQHEAAAKNQLEVSESR